MADEIRMGDRVLLVEIPESLVADLPLEEQAEIRSFVGQQAWVTEVDAHGYCWLGFGSSTDHGDESRYSGHSFCVPRNCLVFIAM